MRRSPGAQDIVASKTLCEHAGHALVNGNLKIAAKCYAGAVVLNPENPTIYIERAGIYYKLKNVSKCVAQCQQAITIAGEQMDAARGRFRQADAAKFQTSIVKAREYLGMVYLLDGDNDSAEVQW